MTEKQLWTMMDQVSLAKKMPAEEKAQRLVDLLLIAYKEDLAIYIGCRRDSDGEYHQTYLNFNEEYPDAPDNRFMVCYTSQRYGKYDPCECQKAAARDIIQNMANKQVIGGLMFNRFSEDPEHTMVIVPKFALIPLLPNGAMHRTGYTDLGRLQ